MEKFQRVTRSILSFLAIVALFIAILISLARALTPLLNQYKDTFENWAEKVIDRPITIGSVHAQFVDFEPVFDFHDVTILTSDKQHRLFHVNNLSIGINLFASIVNLKFITGHIRLSGVHISLRQTKNGEWIINDQALAKSNAATVTGDNIYNMSPETYNVINWILIQQRINLQDIAIHWFRTTGHDVIIPDLDASLINKGDQHRLRGSAEFGFGKKARLTVGADINGQFQHRENLQGTLYIGGNELPLADWLNNTNVFGMKLQDGYCNVKVWLDIANGTLAHIQTIFDMHDFLFQNKDKAINLPLLSANIGWSQLPEGGWSLAGDHIEFQFLNHTPITNEFAIESDQPLTANAMQRIQVDHIHLDELAWFMQHITIVPANMKDSWQKFKIQGSLNKIQFMHQGPIGNLWLHMPQAIRNQINQQPLVVDRLHLSTVTKVNNQLQDDVYFHTDFEHLSWKNLGDGLPEVQNFSGSLIGNLERGYLHIDTTKGSLYMSNVFQHILTFDQIKGMVQWQHFGNDLQVKFVHVKANNNLMNLNVDATVDKLDKNNILVNSVARLDEQDLSQLKMLLPVKIMNTGLRNWLENAFVAGDSLKSIIVFRGTLGDFPFSQQQGQFLADAKLNNVILHFAPDWPSLTNWNADLIFRDDSMHVETKSGTIWDWPLSLTVADIPYLGGSHPAELYVHAQTSAVTSDRAIAFTQIPPLEKTLAGLKQLKMTGPGQLDLHLMVPLTEDKETIVDGKLQLSRNTLDMPNWKVQLQNVNGLLHFTQDGVWSKPLTSTMYGYPTVIQLDTIADKKVGSITQINFDSQIDITKLKQLFDISLLDRLQGSLKYHGLVAIPSKAATTLTVTSNMQGVSLYAPAPYAKDQPQAQDFKLVMNFDTADDSNLWLYYAKLIAAHLFLAKGNLHAADIALGGSTLQTLPTKGIVIHGYVPMIDWDQWKTYAHPPLPVPPPAVNADSSKTAQMANQNKAETAAVPASHEKDALSGISKVNIKVGELKLLKQDLKSISLDVSRQDQAWFVKVKNAMIEGQITWPDNFPKTALKGRFKRLYIQTAAAKKTNGESVSVAFGAGNDQKAMAKPLFSVFDIPPLDIDAKDFQYGLSKIGGVQLQVTPMDRGLRIDNLKIYSELVQLSLTGTWLSEKDAQQTNLAGTAAFKNLGKALFEWNVSKKLRGGQGDANFSINWPSAPYDITVKGMQGNVHVEMKNGALVNLGVATDTKIGIGKVLNLLSFQSILRRLSLNFNDISTAGYSYDIFRGDFTILDGHINTNNTYVNGPVAQLKMHGGVNMVKKNYDLIINMSPHLTSSLPVVATIIGGPIVGAATFLANVLVSPEIETAIGETFLLTGNWDEPQIVSLAGETEEQEKLILHNSNKLDNLNHQALLKQLANKNNKQ